MKMIPTFVMDIIPEGRSPRGLAHVPVSHKTFVSLSDMTYDRRCEQEKDEFSWYKICRPLESICCIKVVSLYAALIANTYLNLVCLVSMADLEDLKTASDPTLFQSCKHQILGIQH